MAQNLIFLNKLNYMLVHIEHTRSLIILFYNLNSSDEILIIKPLFDLLLYLSQSYCFYYYNYFFDKIKKYMEYYKILLMKNKKEEAAFVRNSLPVKIEIYINSEEAELENI